MTALTEKELVQKYNVSGPRYTSYPTAVQFKETDTGDACNRVLNDIILSSEIRKVNNLSLYFHIPFCYSLCWYCGCTKIITKDSDRGDAYLDYLEKEIDLVRKWLNPESNVIQIHFGGGTPTFLRPDQLRRLGEIINGRFKISDDVEFSVEIDPRRCSLEHIEALREAGCNRASLGVQDTNADVQKAIHRIQPYEQTESVTNMLRNAGINGINFDLIYGLPRQTPETFRQTLSDVMQLKPDRLAVYSYAHLPSLMPAQKLLNESEFPSAGQKLEMLMLARRILPAQGMRFIGMDHFAREDDTLSLALDNGTLQRNFQGYSTCGDSETIAFGMSGISQLENIYFQNSKDLSVYYQSLNHQKYPIAKEIKLTRDDKIRRDAIMQIMCRADLKFEPFNKKWNINFDSYFQKELKMLIELEEDQLIRILPDRINITGSGRLFLRNIAMVFDAYLPRQYEEIRYSKTV